jgi:two-component system, LytTR family, sensor kinase
MNDKQSDERQPNRHERQQGRSLRGGKQSVRTMRSWTSAQWRRLTIAVIVGFWLLWYLAFTVFALLNNPELAERTLAPRGTIVILGAVLSFAIAYGLNALRRYRFSVRALAAGILALSATAMHTAFSFQVWMFFIPDGDYPKSSPLVAYTMDIITRVWFFGTVTAVLLVLTYVRDVSEREERISALQALAHGAQLRALRNQHNPHFLFNALNSIAGLLSRKRVNEAEIMTLNLADFLRTTLALDPTNEITLEEEVRLQKLYLDLEKVRFPDRLDVRLDVPPELGKALVPSLITQPLIENSVKHAVARSTAPVEVRLSAAASNGRLQLVVEDNGGNAETGAGNGTHVGLSNVAERLDVHYRGEARLETCSAETGGFRNIIGLPLRFAP